MNACMFLNEPIKVLQYLKNQKKLIVMIYVLVIVEKNKKCCMKNKESKL